MFKTKKDYKTITLFSIIPLFGILLSYIIEKIFLGHCVAFSNYCLHEFIYKISVFPGEFLIQKIKQGFCLGFGGFDPTFYNCLSSEYSLWFYFGSILFSMIFYGFIGYVLSGFKK